MNAKEYAGLLSGTIAAYPGLRAPVRPADILAEMPPLSDELFQVINRLLRLLEEGL